MPRIAPIDPDALTARQAEVYKQIAGGARGGVRGPFSVLLHSPALASCVEKVGVYLRFESGLPDRIKELAIAIVARHWYADVEWNTHAPRAEKLGVPASALAAIAAGQEPAFDEDSDRITYAFVREVLKSSGMTSMPKRIFDEAQTLFGTEGIMDLTGIVGYYTLLAMVMNTFEVRPVGGNVPWRSA